MSRVHVTTINYLPIAIGVTLTLVVLKLFGGDAFADMSWWTVTLMLWIVPVVWGCLVVGFVCLAIAAGMFRRR